MLAILLLPTMVFAAGPAQGDPDSGSSATVDLSFLSALTGAGITYTDAGKAITAGQTMCDLVDEGKQGKELVATLQKHNESLTTERAMVFMAIAFQTYCPQNLEKGMSDPPPKEEQREQEEEQAEEPGTWPGVSWRR